MGGWAAYIGNFLRSNSFCIALAEDRRMSLRLTENLAWCLPRFGCILSLSAKIFCFASTDKRRISADEKNPWRSPSEKKWAYLWCDAVRCVVVVSWWKIGVKEWLME